MRPIVNSTGIPSFIVMILCPTYSGLGDYMVCGPFMKDIQQCIQCAYECVWRTDIELQVHDAL